MPAPRSGHARRRRVHAFGTQGQRPGEFGLVTSVAHDSAGNFYVSEYGEFDRIQKFTPEGKFLLRDEGAGRENGRRPEDVRKDHEYLRAEHGR